MIRKIINGYKMREMSGKYLLAKDVGLFLNLAAYSAIEEDNYAQHYPYVQRLQSLGLSP